MDTLSGLFVLVFFGVSLGAASVTTVVVWIKRRRFPLLYGLLIVTVLLFSCIFIYIFGGTLSAPNQVEETDIANLAIQTVVTLPVVKDQSVQVHVYIFRREQPPRSSSTPQPSVGLTPIGTPGVPIVNAFGPGYDASAVAQLSASAFDVAPQEQPEQSLDQPSSVTFTWTVTPKHAGQQALEVTVTGRWTPKSGGPVIVRPLASQSLSVDVVDTIVFFGRLDVSQLIVVLLSSVLNVPWIVELFKRRRETKRKRDRRSRRPLQ